MLAVWSLLFSAPVVAACGLVIASKMQRFRWIVHLASIVGMWTIGPLIFAWMIEADDLSPAAGFALILFFVPAFIAFALYLFGAVLLLWKR